jgi:hypothetical protein
MKNMQSIADTTTTKSLSEATWCRLELKSIKNVRVCLASRMESFHSVFSKQNEVIPFFVWLKSTIERSRSVLCLVGEPYECRGGEC